MTGEYEITITDAQGNVIQRHVMAEHASAKWKYLEAPSVIGWEVRYIPPEEARTRRRRLLADMKALSKRLYG